MASVPSKVIEPETLVSRLRKKLPDCGPSMSGDICTTLGVMKGLLPDRRLKLPRVPSSNPPLEKAFVAQGGAGAGVEEVGAGGAGGGAQTFMNVLKEAIAGCVPVGKEL
jgi:hypothetical protein